MNRIKLRFCNNIKSSDREVLNAAALAVPGLIALDVIELREGAILILENKQLSYDLLKPNAQKVLKSYNLEAIVPEWHYPDKTVFATNVATLHISSNPEEIAREVQRANNVQVERIYVIKNKKNNRKALKLTLSTGQEAEKLITTGIYLFNSRIPPANVSKERYFKIKQCYVCFQFDHTSNECKKQIPLCSVCGLEHHYKQCPTPDSPYCVNCNGNHHAVSVKCPIIRKKFSKIEKSQKEHDTQEHEKEAAPKNVPNNFPKMPKAKGNTGQQSLPKNNEKHANKIEDTVSNTQTTNCHAKTCKKYLEEKIRYKTWHTYAKMKSKGNEEEYIKIMNIYFLKNNMESFEIPKQKTSLESTVEDAKRENNPNKNPSETDYNEAKPKSKKKKNKKPRAPSFWEKPNQELDENPDKNASGQSHNPTKITESPDNNDISMSLGPTPSPLPILQAESANTLVHTLTPDSKTSSHSAANNNIETQSTANEMNFFFDTASMFSYTATNNSKESSPQSQNNTIIQNCKSPISLPTPHSPQVTTVKTNKQVIDYIQEYVSSSHYSSIPSFSLEKTDITTKHTAENITSANEEKEKESKNDESLELSSSDDEDTISIASTCSNVSQNTRQAIKKRNSILLQKEIKKTIQKEMKKLNFN